MDDLADDPAAQVELWLRQYVDSFGLAWGFPPHHVCLKICHVVFRYGTLDDLENCLVALRAQNEKPWKNYEWFFWKARDWFTDIQHAKRSAHRPSGKA